MRMELVSALNAVKATPPKSKVAVQTKSNYLYQGINIWMHSWKQKGLLDDQELAGRQKLLKNRELWCELENESSRRSVSCRWVSKMQRKGAFTRARELSAEMLRNSKASIGEGKDGVADKAAPAAMPLPDDKSISIYTDGSCLGNPGPGGWGAVVISDKGVRRMKGSETESTNNRMELQAVIKSLGSIKEDLPIMLHTDSKYVQQGISLWMENWLKKGLLDRKKGAGKSRLKNADLWLKLLQVSTSRQIVWKWVKGHANDEYNEMAHRLAHDAARKVEKSR